jgi:hypothetical protein
MCSSHYLRAQEDLDRNFSGSELLLIPGVQATVIKSLTKHTHNPYPFSNLERYLESHINKALKNAPKDIKKATEILVKSHSYNIDYFIQFHLGASLKDFAEYTQKSPMNLLGMAYYDEAEIYLGINMFQDVFSAVSTYLHEAFHLHDPMVIKEFPSKELKDIIVEFRSYLFEASVYPHLKKYFFKEMSYAASPISKKLFEKINSPEAFLELVLNQLYPVGNKYMSRYLFFSVEKNGTMGSLDSSHSYLKKLAVSDTSVLFSFDRKAKMAREFGGHSSKDLKEAIRKLVPDLYKDDLSPERQSKFLSDHLLRERQVANEQVRKDLIYLLQRILGSNSNDLLYLLKEYIKKENLDDIFRGLKLNPPSDYNFPKGANGGD